MAKATVMSAPRENLPQPLAEHAATVQAPAMRVATALDGTFAPHRCGSMTVLRANLVVQILMAAAVAPVAKSILVCAALRVHLANTRHIHTSCIVKNACLVAFKTRGGRVAARSAQQAKTRGIQGVITAKSLLALRNVQRAVMDTSTHTRSMTGARVASRVRLASFNDTLTLVCIVLQGATNRAVRKLHVCVAHLASISHSLASPVASSIEHSASVRQENTVAKSSAWRTRLFAPVVEVGTISHALGN